MKGKRILAAFLALVMVLSTTSVIFAKDWSGQQTFDDVGKKDWSHGYVENLADQDIVHGYGDGTYGPLDQLTRQQAAKMIAIAAGLDFKGKTAKFPDVPQNSEFSGYIAALVEKGAISGFTDGTFRPTDPITRSQAAKMIAAAFGLVKGDMEVDFLDTKNLDPKDKVFIDLLASLGIIKGYEDGKEFRPTEKITRAQFAKILAIGQATASVQRAEAAGATPEDIENAKKRVGNLPDDQDTGTKKSLDERLEKIEEAETPPGGGTTPPSPLAKATTAVKKAEAEITQEAVDSAQALVDALPDSDNKTELQNRLDEVQDKVNALDKEAAEAFSTAHSDALALTDETVAIADKEIVNAALTAYEKLSAGAQGKLTDEKALLDRLEAVLAAKPVIDMIEQLPAVTNLELSHKEMVEGARSEYDSLPEESQPFVNNYQKLLDLESKMAEILSSQALIENIDVEGIWYEYTDGPIEWVKDSTVANQYTYTFSNIANAITSLTFDCPYGASAKVTFNDAEYDHDIWENIYFFGERVPLEKGSENSFRITVTSADANTENTFIISIERNNESPAEINNLNISGILNWEHDELLWIKESENNFVYDVKGDVERAYTNVSYSNYYGAEVTVTINGKVDNGYHRDDQIDYYGKYVDLRTGVNTIVITVESADKSVTNKYTINFNRKISSRAEVEHLDFDGIGWIFDTSGQGYTFEDVAIPSTILRFENPYNADVKVTFNKADYAVTRDDTLLIGGEVELNKGTNTFVIKVTSEDGSNTKEYTYTINRTISSKAEISRLTIAGFLYVAEDTKQDYKFSSDNKPVYTSLDFLNSYGATIRVTLNGEEYKNNDDSSLYFSGDYVKLKGGENKFVIDVTAADGIAKKLYTVTITCPYSEDNLIRMFYVGDVASGWQEWEESTEGYSFETYQDSAYLHFIYPEDATVTVTFNDEAMPNIYDNPDSYFMGDHFDLAIGENTIVITVTAENNKERSHTIKIERKKFSITNLNIDKIYSPGESLYNLNFVTYQSKTHLDFNYPEDATVTVTFNDETMPNIYSDPEQNTYYRSDEVDLALGINTFVIEVSTTDEGEKDTYEIEINRIDSKIKNVIIPEIWNDVVPPDNNKILSSTQEQTHLEFSYPEDATVTVTFETADSAAKDQPNKNGDTDQNTYRSDEVNLKPGINTFVIKVTTIEDAEETYTIDIYIDSE